MSILEGNTVAFGVTGGIAAYKAAEIVRELVRRGGVVQVMMTRGAREFLTPLTLQTLSGQPVATDTFDLTQESEIGHIRLADAADVLLVAPATANLLGKLARGIADDLLSTVALATRAPWVVAPAMNVHMWADERVRENLASLRAMGVAIVDPAEGELACGYEGPGRLADPASIVSAVERALSPQDLAGRKVLVTAGPTREPLDPVRFLTNRSSGRMGFAITAAAVRRGASVVLVSGPVALETPPGARRVDVATTEEMKRAVDEEAAGADLVVMAAAVADYRPVETVPKKIKKSSGRFHLPLQRTSDILSDLAGREPRGFVLVGFAAETNDAIEHARKKLKVKRLDWIVVNDVTTPGAGFDVPTNQVSLLGRDGSLESWPLLAKEEVADRLLTKVTAVAGR